MNEMNNGENNNQNIEQQNTNQNNVVEPVQPQYVQPEQPVNNQEPPKKETKKSYGGLLIVFMVISLLLAGFVVYDKVIKKEEPVKQCENDKQKESIEERTTQEKNSEEIINNEETSNTTKSTEKIEVVDAYVNVEGFGIYKGKGIKIPKITGSSAVIKELNNKIMVSALKTTLNYKDSMMLQLASEDEVKKEITIEDSWASSYDCYKGFNYSYKYYKKNDVLIINVIYDYEENHVVYNDAACWNATGKASNYDDYYFYDIKNDKILSFDEAAQKLNAKFDKESECNNYNSLKNGNSWGTFEAKLDSKGNMTISCYEDIM